MKTPAHKYQSISTEDDDGRPSASIIELTSGKPAIDDYHSISNFGSAFSYSRQINLHTLTEKRPLVGIEKLAHYFVILFCAILTIFLLPWSLVFALKRVRRNEQLVVYRLGRVQIPARRPGLTLTLPFVDYVRRIRTTQNSLAISPTQILCQDNSIIEVHLSIEYNIDDPILVSNSLNDITISLKSLARSTLVSFISKSDGMKIEQQIYTLELSLKNELNCFVRKWGIEIAKVNIVQTKLISTAEENQHNQASLHPALDVFTKIFAGLMQQQQPATATPTPTTVKSTDDSISPVLHLLVKRLKAVLSEELVRQIKTTYQFSIATLGQFYFDLKNGHGSCEVGRCPLSSVDVTITLSNPEDLRLLSTSDSNELVQAYLSQRITIDGSLQDAMNLKYVADALRRDNILLFSPNI
ncbi:unnamed protein product [Rotaria magnacalcarata]|uniref:Band 7 domain-containing protein n=1 Tax=Rotaria magnacalcarata TaxID=392030 RepID=A0A816N4D0_9BILA|nr:unnamed protein product [Rotaria magnacalcarata]CAF3779295.1 unnamed protein product [Rotaria magnacalcarata]